MGDVVTQGTQGTSEDWPTAGGNDRRTGKAARTIEPPLKQIWCCTKTPLLSGGLVVSGGIVVCAHWARSSSWAQTYGIDARDGRIVWSYPMRGIVMGTPAISGDLVYTGTGAAPVCLELGTGEKVWGAPTADPEGDDPGARRGEPPVASAGAPLCLGRLVVYCDEVTAAYDGQSGEVVLSERSGMDPEHNVGPCTDGKSLYLVGRKTISRLILESGTVEARRRTENRVCAGPVVAEGLVVYGSSGACVEALDGGSLEPKWKFEVEDKLYFEFAGTAVESACAFDAGRLFFGGPDGNVYALEAATGKRIWKVQTGSPLGTSPVVSGGTIYVRTEARGLCALSAQTGALLWEHDLGGMKCEFPPNPAVEGSVVFAGGGKGLYAFRSERA